MSDTAKNLANAGLDQGIEAVDLTSKAVIEGLNQLRGVVADVAGAAVGGTDRVTEAIAVEVLELQGNLIERLKALKEAILKPLEVLP